MSKRKKIAVAIVAVLLFVGCALWVRHAWANAQMEKVQRMQEELFAGGRPKPEDFDKLRKEMEKLSPDQRDELMERGMRRGMERGRKRIDDYFKAPPNQRRDVLDKQIAEDEQRRKEWEKRRKENGDGNGQPPGNGSNPNGQNAGQGGSQGGQAGRGRNQNQSPEARSANRNRMLDHTTPDQRAMMAAYHAAMTQRRIQLGLPIGGRPHGGR